MKCKPSLLAFYQSAIPLHRGPRKPSVGCQTALAVGGEAICHCGRGGRGVGGWIGLRNGSSSVLITVLHTCSPYGAVLLNAFLPQPHFARPAPNIYPCLTFLDNCLSCLLMLLKTWIYGSCHVACRKGCKELAMPLLWSHVVASLVWNTDRQLSFSVPLWGNIFSYTIVYQQLTGP